MTNANKTTVRLNLGCGSKRRDGFFGVDRSPCAGADMLCDLARPPPFAESSVDTFFLDNVIEHIQDIPSLVAELVSFGQPGARITIVTPHFTSLSPWRDPTHDHHLPYFSIDHFAKPSTRQYTGGGLNILKRNLTFGGGVLGILGHLFIRISPEKYQRKHCFVFHASMLRFELDVVT